MAQERAPVRSRLGCVTPRFFRFELRTTDPSGASAFYRDVLGDRPLRVTDLPAEARARGAVPHWLGHLGVDDADATARAFVERGATQLGPTRVTPEGERQVLLRGPGAAVMAVTSPAGAIERRDVLGCVLHALDVDRAALAYAEVCGWSLLPSLDLGLHGVVHPFAWQAGGAPVGVLCDVATRPGVHPHWLFQLHAVDLASALDRLRAAGGVADEPITLPDGDRLAVCEDPQGAAFSLREIVSS